MSGGFDSIIFQCWRRLLLFLKKNMKCMVFTTEKESLADLKDYELTDIYTPPGFWGRGLGKALRMLGFPTKWCRSISPYFHPVVKALLEQECDLWIFPVQHPLAYQAPVPALVTIHDLMHRYERRFPEVSTEFKEREQSYTDICHWAKAILVDSDEGKRQVQESYGVRSRNDLCVALYSI